VKFISLLLNSHLWWSPSLPSTWCIAFILADKIRSMRKCGVIGKLTDFHNTNCRKKVNSVYVRSRLAIGMYLFVSYFLSWLSQRLTFGMRYTTQRFKTQEKFFCFECGTYLSKEDMSVSVAGWFGVCKICSEVCDHFIQFRNKYWPVVSMWNYLDFWLYQESFSELLFYVRLTSIE